MRHSEPLRALMLLRRVESQVAQMRLMDEHQARGRAAVALRDRVDALRSEASAAGGDAFAAWLPAARDGAGQAATGLALAEARLSDASAVAASAHLAEKAATEAVRTRDRARRALNLAREQQRLSDIASAGDAAT
jgi:hypothetical protein